MMKSEFDPYTGLTFAKLNSGRWCYERKIFIKFRSMKSALDDVSKLSDEADNLASGFAAMGNIDLMNKADAINFGFLDAKIDLNLYCPSPEEN